MNDKFDRLQSQMVSQRVILERIEKFLMNNGETRKTDVEELRGSNKEDLGEKYKFPLNTVADLKNFNIEIASNPQYKTYITHYLSTICGVDGLQRGDKVGVKLISEIIFTKQLLTLTSWTGISRSANCTEKVAFRTFENVLNVINSVLMKADNRWSQIETEKLFREKVLKHSNKRNAAECKKNQKTNPMITNVSSIEPSNSKNDGNAEDGYDASSQSYDADEDN